ncbi:hypothetical protein BSZ39_12765 [Bowdeniella nasicola]|uniref:Uncharacterized protein n=1 Tax=Bowdeniella nasicola TaxID=208480 RepID=A0A1Q5PUS8_9ACTO|nr:hypothetical protein [Bowdeniella nasicola]OKL51354.1 hypothetical protein BSZ39_12765 [Bowdeniella nasicola]
MASHVKNGLYLFGMILLLGAALAFLIFVVPLLMGIITSTPWVATGIIFVIFIVLVLTQRPQIWSSHATIILAIIVVVGTAFDFVGNPVFNAPFEKLFLGPGEHLMASTMTETIGGEIHTSGVMSIVDADGNVLRPFNASLLVPYRFVVYFGVYFVLLWICKPFVKPRAQSKE